MPGVSGHGGSACEGTGSAHPATSPSRALRRWRSLSWWQPREEPPRDSVWRALMHKPTVNLVIRGPSPAPCAVPQPSHDTHPRRAARPLPSLPVSLPGPFSRQQPLGANTRLPPAERGPTRSPPKWPTLPHHPLPEPGEGAAELHRVRAGPGSPRPR